jgi:hypothetical protein
MPARVALWVAVGLTCTWLTALGIIGMVVKA